MENHDLAYLGSNPLPSNSLGGGFNPSEKY